MIGGITCLDCIVEERKGVTIVCQKHWEMRVEQEGGNAEVALRKVVKDAEIRYPGRDYTDTKKGKPRVKGEKVKKKQQVDQRETLW